MTSATESPATDPYEFARSSAEHIAAKSGVAHHDLALVLGSGWKGAADLLGTEVWSADASTVPGFYASAVAGHAGTVRSIRVDTADSTESDSPGADSTAPDSVSPDSAAPGSPASGFHAANSASPGSPAHVLVLGARTHLYEGRGVDPVVHSVRTAAAAGCRTIVLTNGCGGLDPSWKPGTAVLISDHINHTGETPLVGANFVDMTDVYTPRLQQLAREVDPSLPVGVYMQFRGPSYETPAEVRMARAVGADLVGMSTALEAIAAREAGLDVLGISLVTNLAAGISDQPLSHAEVLQAGQDAAPRIARLLAETVRRILADHPAQ